MRLAFVAPPNSVHTRRWVGWFARAGHDVSIVDPVGVDLQPGLPDTVPVLRPSPGSRIPLLGSLDRRSKLRDLLDALQPDVVHAHYLVRYGWAAAFAGVRPLVVTPWGSDLLQVRRSRLRSRLWNWFALRRADLVTVSSDGMLRAAVAAGARPDRVRHIHHGVDTATFSPGAPSPEMRARLGHGGAPVILSPRSITRLYHHEVVLDAVERLGREMPVAPIMVVTAAGADAATLAGLRRRAEAAGIAERVHVLEAVAADDLPDLYRIADVVVSVPETDSFAVTLLEAMACERPVVASDLPAVAPVLARLDPAAGRLIVPVGDVAATAAAIQRALTLEDGERRRLGAALRAHVVANAEYDTNMAAMEAIYCELSEGGR